MAKAGKHSAKCKRYATAHGQVGRHRIHKGHRRLVNGVIIPMAFGSLMYLSSYMKLHGYKQGDQ